MARRDDMEWAARIGARAKALRLAKHMTLDEVSRAAGLGIGALSEIENGKRESRMKGYERLAKALEVTLGELLGVAARRRPAPRSLAARTVHVASIPHPRS